MILWFLLFFPFHGSNFDRFCLFFFFFLQVSLRIRFELRPVTVSDWSSRKSQQIYLYMRSSFWFRRIKLEVQVFLISTDQLEVQVFWNFSLDFQRRGPDPVFSVVFVGEIIQFLVFSPDQSRSKDFPHFRAVWLHLWWYEAFLFV